MNATNAIYWFWIYELCDVYIVCARSVFLELGDAFVPTDIQLR
jgi:hypothetical protein